MMRQDGSESAPYYADSGDRVGSSIHITPPPTIHLAIKPSIAAGPFILGSTLHRTLSFLRQPTLSSSLFPEVKIAYDKGQPHSRPVLLRPSKDVSLVFAPGSADAGHLACIVVRLAASKSHKNLIVENESGSDEDDTDSIAGSSRSSDAAYRRRVLLTYKGQKLAGLTRGTIQQLFGPTYPARRYLQGDGLHMLQGAKSGTRTESKKQAAPGTKTRAAALTKGKEKWVLGYDGVTFLFDTHTGAEELAKDDGPTHLVVHSGADASDLPDLRWPVISAEFKLEAPPSHNHSALLDYATLGTPSTAHCRVAWSDEAISPLLLHKAKLLPGKGADLFLLPPPYPAQSTSSAAGGSKNTDSNGTIRSHRVELRLRRTTRQDLLLELGPPERKWTKGERTVRKHSSDLIEERDERGFYADWPSAAGFGGATNGSPGSGPTYINGTASDRNRDGHGSSANALASMQDEFWSYPSLGLDMLFRTNLQGEQLDLPIATLEKIVTHSDVPGSATWGRYEFVPWYIEQEKASGGSTSAQQVNIETRPSELRAFMASLGGGGERNGQSSESMAKKTASAAASSEVKKEKETMHLDRSAEAEFRSLLRLDVRTELQGYPGAVAEVLLLPSQSVPQTDRKSAAEEGIVVAWTIVPTHLGDPSVHFI